MKTAAFKNTDIGPIPEDWEVKKLGELCEVLDNRRVPLNDSQRKKGPYPYCGANGIVDYIDRYAFEGKVILIAEDGGNFSDFATRPIAYQMDGKFWVNNHAHVLVSKEGVCQEFLFCQLVHKDITDVISGGTRAKLTRGQLDDLLMVLPPLPEQRRIAAALSDADELVASLDKLIEKKKRVKEGAMQRLLSGETRLPGFTGKWVEKKLGECGSWLGGGTPSTSIPGYWNGSTPWISSSDIEEGNIWHITKSRFISKNAISNSATCICPKGTLHIVARVGIGKVAIASEPTCTSQDYANLVIAQDDVVFLAYLLSSVMRSKKDETQGTSIKGLSLDDLKSILLLLPPLSEQQAIAGVLSDMDAEIAALSRERAEAERIKQGMMQELLTGKVRLT